MTRRSLWLLLLITAALALAPVQSVVGQSPVQVGVVVQEGADSVATYCVTLTEPEPTGYDALVATGLPIVAAISAQGLGVCQIGDTGCPASNCFCQCQGATCNYWAYAYRSDGAWLTSNVGAGARQVSHGDVEGWRWGPGDPPPLFSFAQICAEGAPPSSVAEPEAPDRPTVPPGRQAAFVAIAIAVGAGGLAIAASANKRS